MPTYTVSYINQDGTVREPCLTTSNYSLVIRHIVDSLCPFDPTCDDDVEVFLKEELNNEHSDLELARYELCERINNVATDVASWEKVWQTHATDVTGMFEHWQIAAR